MKYIPHEYQSRVTDYILSHPISAIFLDCGLGKTVITLTAIAELVLDRLEVRRVLIVAPLRVAQNSWPDELRKWDHLSDLSYVVAVGSPEERKAALEEKAMITIINRENVPWLVEESGARLDFDMIVVDELSSFKNHRAKRFRALMKLRPLARRVVGLTGTPTSNGLMDLWAEIGLLDMGKRLGKFITHYREEFFRPDKRNGMRVFSWKLKEGAEQEIYRRIGDITVSMRGLDHLQMPECFMNCYPVRMNVKEMAIYCRLRDEMFLELGDHEIDAMNAAVLTGKLLQLSSGAIYEETDDPQEKPRSVRRAIAFHERKLDALEDVIESANGRPVLIAYWYRHEMERIRSRFPDARELLASSDISDWNAGKISVALIHPASAGHGLNLQSGGNILVWFTLPWSLELYQQTNARLWRQGQQASTVMIYHLMMMDTIDEKIYTALQRKESIQDALLEAVRMQKGV